MLGCSVSYLVVFRVYETIGCDLSLLSASKPEIGAADRHRAFIVA